MTMINFIMEKLYPVAVKPHEYLERGDMQALVGKVIRANFDVVELATDSWCKEPTETFLDMISDLLAADPALAARYKEWNERRLECEGDDMEADNPRDRADTGTSVGSLNRR